MLELFENHNARTLAYHKAVAVPVPRAAGFFRFIIASRQRTHRRKPAHTHRRDRRLRAARDHYVCIVVLDDSERIADGMGAGRARRCRSLIRSLRAATHRNLARREIDNGRRNEERRDLPRPAFDERRMFALDDVESANSRADVHAHPLVVLRRDLEPRHFERLIRGSKRQVDEAPHLLDFFFLDEVQWIEILDLGCDLAGKIAGVKAGDPADAALSSQQGFPHIFGGIPYTTDQPKACDYDPASQLFARLGVLADVIDGVLYGADLLGILVRNLDIEGLFKGHDEFNGVQRIGTQVVYKRRARSDFALIHAQLLHNNLFYLLVNGCHVSPRLPVLTSPTFSN